MRPVAGQSTEWLGVNNGDGAGCTSVVVWGFPGFLRYAISLGLEQLSITVLKSHQITVPFYMSISKSYKAVLQKSGYCQLEWFIPFPEQAGSLDYFHCYCCCKCQCVLNTEEEKQKRKAREIFKVHRGWYLITCNQNYLGSCCISATENKEMHKLIFQEGTQTNRHHYSTE